MIKGRWFLLCVCDEGGGGGSGGGGGDGARSFCMAK